MTRSPQGAKFLAAREQFVKEFALTRIGKKRMLALLATYDELLFEAYRPHAVGVCLNLISGLRAKYVQATPTIALTDGPEAEPLRINIAQRTVLTEAFDTISHTIDLKPEKTTDATPNDVPPGDRPGDSVG